jgi:hypothetical protein
VKENKKLSDGTLEEMEKVSKNLEQHVEHMAYNCYKKSGLPMGTCNLKGPLLTKIKICDIRHNG